MEEEVVDSSVEFALLDALRRVLQSAIGETSETVDGAYADLFRRALAECFARLRINRPSAVRHAAAQCVGVLTRVLLRDACDLFIAKLVSCRSGDAVREYVPVQRAVRHFKFGINSPTRIAATARYIGSLATHGKSVDRGVLRQEVCMSVIAILQGLASQTPLSNQQWVTFAKSTESADFWHSFVEMFRVTLSWARRPKHAAFCYQLLGFMVGLGGRNLFSQLSVDDLLGVAASIREKTSRTAALEFARDFLLQASVFTAGGGAGGLQRVIESLVLAVLRRTASTESDSTVVSSVLVAACKALPSFTMNAMSDLANHAPPADTRDAILLALGTLFDEQRQTVVDHGAGLEALLTSAVDSVSKRLLTIPTLCVFGYAIQDATSEPTIRMLRHIVDVASQPRNTQPMANAAASAILTFVKASPARRLPVAMEAHARFIGSLRMITPECAAAALDSAREVISLYMPMVAAGQGEGQAYSVTKGRSVSASQRVSGAQTSPAGDLAASAAAALPTAAIWREARCQLEGAALAWLAAPITRVRNAALNLLHKLGTVEVQTVEGHVVGDSMPVAQCEASLPHAADAWGEWPPELEQILVNPKCARSVSQAWRCTYRARVWCAGNERHLRFLVVGLPPPPTINRKTSSQGAELKDAMDAFLTQQHAPAVTTDFDTFVMDAVGLSLGDDMAARVAARNALALLPQMYVDRIASILRTSSPASQMYLQAPPVTATPGQVQPAGAQPKRVRPHPLAPAAIALLAAIVNAQRLGSTPELMRVTEEWTQNWSQQASTMSGLPDSVRRDAATVIAAYAKRLAETGGSARREEAGALRELLDALLPSSGSRDSPDVVALADAVAQGVAALSALGGASDAAIRLLVRCAATSSAAEDAMVVVASRSLAALDAAVGAATGFLTPNSAVRCRAWSAVVRYCKGVLQTAATENTLGTPGSQALMSKLLVLALLQLCAPPPQARVVAAEALSFLKNVCQLQIQAPSPAPPARASLQRAAAAAFSAAAAKQHPDMTWRVVEEAGLLVDILHFSQLTALSEVLAPWLRNVATLVAAGATAEQLNAAMKHVLILGRSAGGSLLWESLIQGPAAAQIADTAATATATLLAECTTTGDDAAADACRDAASYIAMRQPACAAKALCALLRPASESLDVKEIVAAKQKPESSTPPTDVHLAAFELLADAASAGAPLTAEAAPTVLCNAALHFANKPEMLVHADALLASILHLADASVLNASDIGAAADALKARNAVARGALNWATGTSDRASARRALQLYRTLAVAPTKAEIAALSSAMLVDLSRGAMDDAASAAATLATLAVEGELDSEAATLLARVSLCALPAPVAHLPESAVCIVRAIIERDLCKSASLHPPPISVPDMCQILTSLLGKPEASDDALFVLEAAAHAAHESFELDPPKDEVSAHVEQPASADVSPRTSPVQTPDQIPVAVEVVTAVATVPPISVTPPRSVTPTPSADAPNVTADKREDDEVAASTKTTLSLPTAVAHRAPSVLSTDSDMDGVVVDAADSHLKGDPTPLVVREPSPLPPTPPPTNVDTAALASAVSAVASDARATSPPPVVSVVAVAGRPQSPVVTVTETPTASASDKPDTAASAMPTAGIDPALLQPLTASPPPSRPSALAQAQQDRNFLVMLALTAHYCRLCLVGEPALTRAARLGEKIPQIAAVIAAQKGSETDRAEALTVSIAAAMGEEALFDCERAVYLMLSQGPKEWRLPLLKLVHALVNAHIRAAAQANATLLASFVQRCSAAITPLAFSPDAQVRKEAILTISAMLPAAPKESQAEMFAFAKGLPAVASQPDDRRLLRCCMSALGNALSLPEFVATASPSRRPAAGATEDIDPAIKLFNQSTKKGLQMLRDQGMDAVQIADYLLHTPGVDKVPLGQVLGERHDFNRAILAAFVKHFNFTTAVLDEALRDFLQSFRLPGEAQMIDRVMETFAKRFNECNTGVFSDPDTAYVLAFSIIMLNTDAHSPHVRRKMTLADWLKNNRGLDNGKDLPKQMLESIYQRITTNEIILKDN
eukprot:TRINITY_DN1124_c0_g1_i1.p1 TRINITY_DN1124_c0_g1~~TRINITY_DN1124_c0_g1_i1.p1  ORF type:complete len:2131 (+),score=596.94 TRINITY_DN1124_c0_g1_i1:296-6394(+)